MHTYINTNTGNAKHAKYRLRRDVRENSYLLTFLGGHIPLTQEYILTYLCTKKRHIVSVEYGEYWSIIPLSTPLIQLFDFKRNALSVGSM